MSIFSGKAPSGTDGAHSASPAAVTPIRDRAAPQVAAIPAAKDRVEKTEDDSSCIGPGMTITGKVVTEGALKLYGRMEGELRASVAEICDKAEFEGNIIAQELTISGHVKGTIHALRVKLGSSAVVQGDIFHRSLSIEENAQFEGSSRRQDNPTDASPAPQEKAPNLQPQEESTYAKEQAHDGSPFDKVVSAAT